MRDTLTGVPLKVKVKNMKKRISALFSVFLALLLIGSTGVSAQDVPAAQQEVQQVIDVDSMGVDTIPAADSYTIVDDGEVLLEVVHVKTPGMTAALNSVTSGGCYTAEFMIPETNDKVFLTGLTQDNTDEIRQAIVENYTEGGDFELKNLGFIDSEKTWYADGDENMCWAAASSNILTYTGWAAQAGFNSADDLFEEYIASFSDGAGSVFYGFGWFFNGIVGTENVAQPTAGTGAFLSQYFYRDVAEIVDIDSDGAVNFGTLYDRLHDGCGVSLGVNIYGPNGFEGGHSVSCWGFVTDIRYPSYDKRRYKSVLITDSDSDKYYVQDGMDRRDADDVMSLYALEPFEQNGVDTFSFAISDHQTAVMAEAITLRPYSTDIPVETDPDATKSSTSTTDIALKPFFLTDDSSVEQTKTTFAPGSEIYYQPWMANVSSVTYNGPLYLSITVRDANGVTQYSRSFNYSTLTTVSPARRTAFSMTKINKVLPVGDYTITASFNPNHNVTEAYYYNNTMTLAFKIRESYLLGDVDGDGTISIIDVTSAQRMLAGLDDPADDALTQRGDIDESGALDILDATVIQRYLSNVPILYTIAVEQFYE